MSKFKLIGNLGKIEQVNDNTCKAIINNLSVGASDSTATSNSNSTPVEVYFPLKDLHKWIEKLEVHTNDDGGIRLSSDFFE